MTRSLAQEAHSAELFRFATKRLRQAGSILSVIVILWNVPCGAAAVEKELLIFPVRFKPSFVRVFVETIPTIRETDIEREANRIYVRNIPENKNGFPITEISLVGLAETDRYWQAKGVDRPPADRGFHQSGSCRSVPLPVCHLRSNQDRSRQE